MFILGKLKTYVIAALALLLPILYVLGRRDGKKINQTAVLEDELRAQADASDFYKVMAEHEEDYIPTTNSELADRLRKHGL
jgi:hypothetical protein